MHDTTFVDRVQRPCDRHEHLQDLPPRARPLAEPLIQRDAVDELHGDEHARQAVAFDQITLERTDVVHRHDVRMRQPSHRLGLAQEPSATGRGVGRSARVQHLHGDAAVELRVVRREHDPHRAGAEALEHDVATERGAPRQPALAEDRPRHEGDLVGLRPRARQTEPRVLFRHVRRGYQRSREREWVQLCPGRRVRAYWLKLSSSGAARRWYAPARPLEA